VPFLLAFLRLWYGATSCVVIRLKGDDSINIPVLEIFHKYGFHEN
jgi:hypothetical protein